MSDIYLWYQQLPNVDPARYATPEAYPRGRPLQALDSSFSYIADRAATEALFSSSQYAGFGFSSAFGPADDLRIAQVFPGSPAAEAGLLRGDQIVRDQRPVGGRAAARPGSSATPTARRRRACAASWWWCAAGAQQRVSMVKRAVMIPTVSNTTVFDVGGRRVGYIFFRNFVEPSFEALAEAFATLERGRRQRSGAGSALQRRRPGGRGAVPGEPSRRRAHRGAGVRGVLAQRQNAFRNEVLRFETQPGALRLERLVVITTQASASASELVINSLRPFIPVVIVGDRTYGKPVGQYAIPFCDKILAPVSFQLRNANGEGDFFDGLPWTARRRTIWSIQIGDPMEGSLREALTVITTGACSAPASA